MNITDTTINAIQQMVNESFLTNSILDRMKTCLNADLAYPNTALLVHKLAHKYSLNIGDSIGDLIENYNVPVIYGNIPLQDKTYLTAEDVLSELLDVVIDFENKLNMCAKIAFDNMDLHVYQGLLEVIEEHTKYVQQAILWKDEIVKYKDNPSFDAHIIQHYNILGD